MVDNFTGYARRIGRPIDYVRIGAGGVPHNDLQGQLINSQLRGQLPIDLHISTTGYLQLYRRLPIACCDAIAASGQMQSRCWPRHPFSLDPQLQWLCRQMAVSSCGGISPSRCRISGCERVCDVGMRRDEPRPVAEAFEMASLIAGEGDGGHAGRHWRGTT